MGSRDHSETCDVCGVQRGGLNELRCDCYWERALNRIATDWNCSHELLLCMSSLGANIAISAALCRAFRLGQHAVSCGNCDFDYHDTKWVPGCNNTPEAVREMNRRCVHDAYIADGCDLCDAEEDEPGARWDCEYEAP